MKISLLLLSAVSLLFCGALTAFGQIPNASFENWTNNLPDGWGTNNIASVGWAPVTRSSTAHGGSSSVRGDVIISVASSTYAPQIASGVDMRGFAWTQRSGFITGYYQFFPAAGSGDRFSIMGSLMKGGANGTGVAVGGGYVTTAASSWTQFSVPFSYSSSNTPDWASLTFNIVSSGSGSAHAGSYFLLDDLAFSGTASAVNDLTGVPQTFSLEQNYPNPFNPKTLISYQIPAEGLVTLRVCNLLGQEVATLVNGNVRAGGHSVTFDASNLSSGTYLYTLQFGDRIASKAMVLVK